LKPPKNKRVCRACPLVDTAGIPRRTLPCAHRIKAAESYLNGALHTTRFHHPDLPVIQESCTHFLWIKLCATINRNFQTASTKAACHFEYFLYKSLYQLKTYTCAYSTEPAINSKLQICMQGRDFSGCAQAAYPKAAIFP
jgi:hypothetical protein